MTEQPEVQRSTEGPSRYEDPAAPSARRRRWPLVVALLLHIFGALVYFGSGLVVPGYATIFLWGLWYAFLALTVYVWRRRPLLAWQCQ